MCFRHKKFYHQLIEQIIVVIEKTIYFCEKMENKLCDMVRYPLTYFFALSMEKKSLGEKKEPKFRKKIKKNEGHLIYSF